MNKDDLERLAATLGGLCILGCLPGSPSEQAGLRYGDVLLEVNGMPTPDWAAFIAATRERGPIMSIRFFRDGAELTAALPLREHAPLPGALELVQSVLASGAMPASVQPDDDEPVLLS